MVVIDGPFGLFGESTVSPFHPDHIQGHVAHPKFCSQMEQIVVGITVLVEIRDVAPGLRDFRGATIRTTLSVKHLTFREPNQAATRLAKDARVSSTLETVLKIGKISLQ